MLEKLVADVLVRVLGQYVHGITADTVRVGVWSGHLTLERLALRPDALAILFESLGLDLPVTVIAGYVGNLTLHVPWKALRSEPVVLSVDDLSVVAAPVSDGDQEALSQRDLRLKASRLATDDAFRQARESVRAAADAAVASAPGNTQSAASSHASNHSDGSTASSSRLTRWRQRLTASIVTSIVNNIQIRINNVIVQYQDASSVLLRPYTVSFALESLRAISTNSEWKEAFVTETEAALVRKVVYLDSLVANWEPGTGDQSHVTLSCADWAAKIRKSDRHVIRPVHGELRVALASAVAQSRSASKQPRVQMDLCFPEVALAFDDFQYHTLLSTIMYLSDIDRKVRPKTARGRWQWAVDRLLPRFKERHEARMRLAVEGLRARREQRELYVRARKAVIFARQRGIDPDLIASEASVVADMETILPLRDVLLFRDIVDMHLREEKNAMEPVAAPSRIWNFFGRSRVLNIESKHDDEATGVSDAMMETQEAVDDDSGDSRQHATPQEDDIIDSATDLEDRNEGINDIDDIDDIAPIFRMAFLLGCGSIQLNSGGFPHSPKPMSCLEFRELRLGVTTWQERGFLIEGLLGTLEVIDLQRNLKVMYPRVEWSGVDHTSSAAAPESAVEHSEHDYAQGAAELNATPDSLSRQVDDSEKDVHRTQNRAASDDFLSSYPTLTSEALEQLRVGHVRSDPLLFVPSKSGLPCDRNSTQGLRRSAGSASTSSFQSDLSSLPSVSSHSQRDDMPVHGSEPRDYLVALRLQQETCSPSKLSHVAQNRLGMDLAIGGMEAVVDGPNGVFVSSIQFWHPREKLPSIMKFLSRAAAPRLASLRMNLQRALLDRKAPMRMDLLIRGPRFIFPSRDAQKLSLIVDLGTFAMETASGEMYGVSLPSSEQSHGKVPGAKHSLASPADVQCTDYRMTVSDLGVFISSAAKERVLERLIKPFSLRLLLQVLHDAAYVEAIVDHLRFAGLARFRLFGYLSSVKTTISHTAFRQLLEVAHQWSNWVPMEDRPSGIEPNSPRKTLSKPADENIRGDVQQREASPALHSSRKLFTQSGRCIDDVILLFEMRLELNDLRLELRDISGKRVVTLSSRETLLKFSKGRTRVELGYAVKSFTIEDGSRGATAPFRQLLHACETVDTSAGSSASHLAGTVATHGDDESSAIMMIHYVDDILSKKQEIDVKVQSLRIICVRETYLALADFFYKVDDHSGAASSDEAARYVTAKSSRLEIPPGQQHSTWQQYSRGEESNMSYEDPFAAVGMTTSSAVKALRTRAERGMQLSKKVFADRGELRVRAELAGFVVTLITAEGALASLQLEACAVRLLQTPAGHITASGEFDSFSVRDLTAAYDALSHTVFYQRVGPSDPFSKTERASNQEGSGKSDGWTLDIPASASEAVWFRARLSNLQVLYVQRFIVILRQYVIALRDELQPVLSIKGGLSDIFETDIEDRWKVLDASSRRLQLYMLTENIDFIMPRHSQCPHEALRFLIARSVVTNEELPAPGYLIGMQLVAEGITSFVIHDDDRSKQLCANDPNYVPSKSIPVSFSPLDDTVPFSSNLEIVGKLDLWRLRRVPQVVLNADGDPVLKDGELEVDYDPQQWLPAIRARLFAPRGIDARLCEAEYTILYFVFTENIIERPEIEFTDIVRGLKTPILPPRQPVKPIMLSSNRLPPNYSVVFDVPRLESIISYGSKRDDPTCHLLGASLSRINGAFDYGVDFRMSFEVFGDVEKVDDLRPGVNLPGHIVEPLPITTDSQRNGDKGMQDRSRTVAFTWDRPYGHRANLMLVVSNLRVVVVPELFRDLSLLTAPGFPFLTSSAPAPWLRFNGRQLIVTLSNPEILLMSEEYPADCRLLVVRGEVIAKIHWAAVTGRLLVEVSASNLSCGLSAYKFGNNLEEHSGRETSGTTEQPMRPGISISDETPVIYPVDVSLKYHAGGYDPPPAGDESPIRAPGSTVEVNMEYFLARVDVNDIPILLAVGTRLAASKQSPISARPPMPGRFDQWIDLPEEGDAKLSVQLALPHARLLFTDDTDGRCVPILEARARDFSLLSNVPWLTSARVQFSVDLFNEKKGWWEPGIERFPAELVASQGRSGSTAVNIRTAERVEVNLTPSTVSGAARVAKTFKQAVENLILRKLNTEMSSCMEDFDVKVGHSKGSSTVGANKSRRPTVAAFCVQNCTGRSVSVKAVFESTRHTLRGCGDELEVDLPTDGVMWSASGGSRGSPSDPNEQRHAMMRCIVNFGGYDTVCLSAAEVGIERITLMPSRSASTESTNVETADDYCPSAIPVTILWDVSMRDGVPVGTLRSTQKIVNETRTVLEILVGERDTTSSVGSGPTASANARSPTCLVSDHQVAVLEAGKSFFVPLRSVGQSVRLRPALFHAPENDSDRSLHSCYTEAASQKQRVLYSYLWSEPLFWGQQIRDSTRISGYVMDEWSTTVTLSNEQRTPSYLLSCRPVAEEQPYTFSVHSVIHRSSSLHGVPSTSLDRESFECHVTAPIILENLLPRSLAYALADSDQASLHDSNAIMSKGVVEPLREAHIHTAGGIIERLAVGFGVENSSTSQDTTDSVKAFSVKELHRDLSALKSVPLGPSRSSSLILRIDRVVAVGCCKFGVYADFWIENRSDVDLFFRDFASREAVGNASLGRPKVFLPSCPAPNPANPFVCFSGRWLSFQRADATEDVWIDIPEDLTEVDKPIPLAFEGLGLSLFVRPARGKLQQALIVSIRNSAFVQNRTDVSLQWCQSAALSSRGILLSSRVHDLSAKSTAAIHWDFVSEEKSICLRLVNSEGQSDWIWSRAVPVENVEGEFVAKMYHPKRHEQYIARALVSKLGAGTFRIAVYPEDKNNPPYRIVNNCLRRSIAFRQSGADETHPWLVRPGKTTRYSWDDPRAPLKRRTLVVEVIESRFRLEKSSSATSFHEISSKGIGDADTRLDFRIKSGRAGSRGDYKHHKFELGIDVLGQSIAIPGAERLSPALGVSVTVDGPTKVVTFFDKSHTSAQSHESKESVRDAAHATGGFLVGKVVNIDVEVFVESVGVSMIDSTPTELAFTCLSGVLFRLDRFDTSQLILFEVSNIQIDNQLANAVWPVALWSPDLSRQASCTVHGLPPNHAGDMSEKGKKDAIRRPVLQFTSDSMYPPVKQGINRFRGIFASLQTMQIAADEEFVLRIWLYVQSLLVASGELEASRNENIGRRRVDEVDAAALLPPTQQSQDDAIKVVQRLYVEQLELCPIKLRVSFTSSRSASVIRLPGYRSLIRTLISAFGNVDNAELRFNALELRHVFDTMLHFRSLTSEYYRAQLMSQKMSFLSANPLIGNPSALFDSIAIGTRDFFVEPARAKGSAEFVAGIGRGSSSLLTNTFGGLVGSLGGIPRAVAQGLETAVGDSNYLAERDLIRGRARFASSPAQGLFTGALSFGHGIASGAAGLVREPVVGALESGPSGFIMGLGKGVIGGVLKPIAGALDLIGEPAVGFRSMMISSARDAAEPLRPPRAFWGTAAKRLVAYDEEAALGQSILNTVGSLDESETSSQPETLKTWKPLVAVSADTSRSSLISFLWILHHRSLPNSQLKFKPVVDGNGEQIRAEKMKCALLTQFRFLIASLDGRVLWQRSVSSIADTQVSRAPNDILMVGTVSSGQAETGPLPPRWERISCGSVENRDALNSSLRRMLRPHRMSSVVWRGDQRQAERLATIENDGDDKNGALFQDGIEMVDMSELEEAVDKSEKVSLQAQFEARPIRNSRSATNGGVAASPGPNLRLSAKGTTPLTSMQRADGRSIRLYIKIIVRNESSGSYKVISDFLHSGKWRQCEESRCLAPRQTLVLEAFSDDYRVCDLSGHVSLQAEALCGGTGCERKLYEREYPPPDRVTIFFNNPMLAANAYSVECPPHISVNRVGGDRGDCPVVTFHIVECHR